MKVDSGDEKKLRTAYSSLCGIQLDLYDDPQFEAFVDNLARARLDLYNGILFCEAQKNKNKEYEIEDLSSDESMKIDDAIKMIRRKMEQAGAPENRMYDDNYIDYRLTLIYYDMLEETGSRKMAINAVQDFAFSFTYNPSLMVKQPVFPLHTDAA